MIDLDLLYVEADLHLNPEDNFDDSDLDPSAIFEKQVEKPRESSVLNCLETKQ